MKLRWSALAGGSEKQLTDALGVYEFQGDNLDQEYPDEWAERLGVTAALKAVRAAAAAG